MSHHGYHTNMFVHKESRAGKGGHKKGGSSYGKRGEGLKQPHHRISGTVVVASDDHRWWIATPDQEKAYLIGGGAATVSDPKGIKVYVDSHKYYCFRETFDEDRRWIEIQDRTYPHMWREIKPIGGESKGPQAK